MSLPGRLFPEPPRGEGWRSGKAGGIPFLVERGLPYPCAISASGRATTRLDGTWLLRFDPEELPPEAVMAEAAAPAWEETRVPSVYNAANGERTAYRGVVWYRRDFAFEGHPAAGGAVRLCLHGVLLRGTAWLNGTLLGSFEGGYTPRYFDLTPAIGAENTLFVRTDNRLTRDSLPMATRLEHNPGWHAYGGVYRSVELEVLPPHSIVKASARIERGSRGCALVVEALTWDRSEVGRTPAPRDDRLDAVLEGRGGPALALPLSAVADEGLEDPGSGPGSRLVAWRGSLEVEGLRPWSPADPATYTLSAALGNASGETDRVELVTGFRSFAVAGEKFLLNGEPVFLKGISKHEDHPDLGPTQTPELIESDLGLIKELGANYVRLAHYPHDGRELERARDLGLMLSGEIPLYQAGTGFAAWFQEKRPLREFPLRLFGLRQVASRALIDNARRQLAEMIERDRNNPAIVFWCVGNECYTLGRRAGRIFSRLRDTAKYFDPDRPVTNVELTYHVPILDALKRGWTGMDFYCLNSYFGWYYGSLDELPAFLARLRRRWKGKPLVLSEFGADAAPGRRDSDGPWKAERVSGGKTYSEEYQESVVRGYRAEAARHPWIQGLSPWVFSDFYNTWFPSNPVPNYNLKGMVSSRREPKAAYRALKELYHGRAL
jgi:beta-glucuronidase